jgi:hypothetical protein
MAATLFVLGTGLPHGHVLVEGRELAAVMLAREAAEPGLVVSSYQMPGSSR